MCVSKKIVFVCYIMIDPQPTSCDIHDQTWLSNLLLSYNQGIGRDVCDYISSFLVVRFESSMIDKRFICVGDTEYGLIECSSLCPHYGKNTCCF